MFCQMDEFYILQTKPKKKSEKTKKKAYARRQTMGQKIEIVDWCLLLF